MRERSLFLPMSFGILIVAATVFAVVPALLKDRVTSSRTTDGPSSPSAGTTSSVETSINSLQPSDGSAARPTATFPAFAARGGGLYATDAGEAP